MILLTVKLFIIHIRYIQLTKFVGCSVFNLFHALDSRCALLGGRPLPQRRVQWADFVPVCYAFLEQHHAKIVQIGTQLIKTKKSEKY